MLDSTATSSHLLAPLAGTLAAAYLVFKLVTILQEEFTSSLRNLPGPRGAWPLLGHMKAMNARSDDVRITYEWRQEFGTNYQFRGLFNSRELFTTDTKALGYILANDQLYQKGPLSKRVVTELLGGGLLSVEDEEHKRHNPAFGIPQLRAQTEIFNEKSIQLRNIWARELISDSKIDVYSGLRKMTLDVIGLAGFNYNFNALDNYNNAGEEKDELQEAFAGLLQSPMSGVLRALFPILRFVVRRAVHVARTKMLAIAHHLLADSKAAAVEAKSSGAEGRSSRDLLSIMVRANLSADVPKDQRLTDAEVVAQIPTFFLAGHETSSTATAWVLYALSLNPSVQSKLREELLTLNTENPSMDELNSLEYLENVVRESMRLHSPVEYTIRQAMADDVLPLRKSYADRNGRTYSSISIRKGTVIRIPIACVHYDKELWGEDAEEFRPERWDDLPEVALTIPGVWAHLLTFISGPHNCIGFRFSLIEIKALLFTLVRAFEFRPAEEIGYTSTPVKKPFVLGEKGKRGQLPLVVVPYVS
ncbi:cytochrome P450 [Roridomyces roridus]|uniref:Cytochrome P450 n=1 Tax=Roridomyces roridus TaxID=1738132 RepID=A0AAD7C143_9AGAR|nr:cytochrome P450 [Roridomyces roridus]